MLSKKDYSELWGYLDILISQYSKALSNETDDSKIVKQHKEIQRLRDLQNAIQEEIDSRDVYNERQGMTMIEFEEMTFTVRKETADNIRHLSKVSGMSNGEVIETALMNLSAKNSDVAPILALQEILMILNSLSGDEANKAFVDIIVHLLTSIPLNDDIVKALYSKTLELQKHTYGRLLSDTEDTISVLDSINSIKVNTAEQL